jgi:hypothetical protein
MKIYLTRFRHSLPSNSEYPCFSLVKDQWDDFGFRTLFRLYYFDEFKKKQEIGLIKILEKGKKITSIQNVFEKLPSNFCSLGNGLEYYKKIYEIFADNSKEILSKFNDCAIDENVYIEFKEDEGFNTSLIRFSEEEKAFYQAKDILNGVTTDKNFTFKFSCKLNGASLDHCVDISFNQIHKSIPNRIFCLIGKNGTGKTQYLGKLALGMSGQEPSLKKNFQPLRPLFSRIIVISYSIFDDFPKPQANDSFSYYYFGFKDNNKINKNVEFQNKLRESILNIIYLQKQEEWKKLLEPIIDSNKLDDLLLKLIEKRKIDVYKYLGVSSGQGIILNVVSHVLSVITDDSLIIFDEPEMHLHPNAISQLIKILYDLLNETNSYAILATHSPIIIQQIPSNYVRVLERQENIPSVRGISNESFGENLSLITNDVFGNINEVDYYKLILKSLVKKIEVDELNHVFQNGLSLNAKIYFESLKHEAN